MKSTVVDAGGNVRCPKCGSKQFTAKRTGKAKLTAAGLGVLTFGAGGVLAAGAMPKRLKCQGCGENLKTGSAKDSKWKSVPGAGREARPMRVEQPAAPARTHSLYDDVDEVKMRADEVRVGDQIKGAGRVGIVQDIETLGTGNLKLYLDAEQKPVKMAPFAKVKVRRLPGGDG